MPDLPCCRVPIGAPTISETHFQSLKGASKSGDEAEVKAERLTFRLEAMEEERRVGHRSHKGGQGLHSWRSMRPTSAIGRFSRRKRGGLHFDANGIRYRHPLW